MAIAKYYSAMETKRTTLRVAEEIFRGGRQVFGGIIGILGVGAAIALADNKKAFIWSCAISLIGWLIIIGDLAYRNVVLKEKLRPKIRVLKCAPTVPTRVRISGPTQSITAMWVYYRLHVAADCIGQIKDCEARLSLIVNEGNPIPIWGNDNASLTFAQVGTEFELKRPLSDKVEDFIDVLAVDQNGHIFPGTPHRVWRFPTPSFQEAFSHPGDYLLTINLTSPDTKTTVAILRFSRSADQNRCKLSVDSVS